MTAFDAHSGLFLPPARRRDGREGSRELTRAYRRYVEAVQRPTDPCVRDDVEAALTLAREVMGLRRDAEVDAALRGAHAAEIRALGTAVRRAGSGAVAHPALLARAIVLARTLEQAAAGAAAREGLLAGR